MADQPIELNMPADLADRYMAACHRMQSGVALIMESREPSGETTPKHLRVGVNSAMSDAKAMVRLMIAKGVFTDQEYFEAITVAMEEEAAMYEARVQEIYGPKVTLG